MTPDLVAELLRQLMKEAMILAAPLLIAAALLSFVLSLLQTLTSLQEQSLTIGAAAGGDRADSAGGDALVSGAAGDVYAAAAGRLSPVSGMSGASRVSELTARQRRG